ncbi:UPF0225 protein [Spirochaetia bacterium]|nr:UPF0225 protein [Spirochaetia bacterium]
MKLCHCGSGLPYDECCGPFILGTSLPPTAEALMRSRYSAYVEHAIDYIIDTCVDEGRQKIDYKQTKDWSERSRWMGLKILSVEKGGVIDTEGTVEFEAEYEREGLKDVHHEKASFTKKDGRWLYDDGQVAARTIVRSGPRIGRNEPCPCGSGKKYKFCHGRPS